MNRIHGKLTATLRSQSDLCRFAAEALTIATALGFIGGAFAALETMRLRGAPNSVHYGLVVLFAGIVFAVEWCSENGPSRWRPFLISEERLKTISTTAVGLLVAVGALAVIINCRIGHI